MILFSPAVLEIKGRLLNLYKNSGGNPVLAEYAVDTSNKIIVPKDHIKDIHTDTPIIDLETIEKLYLDFSKLEYFHIGKNVVTIYNYGIFYKITKEIFNKYTTEDFIKINYIQAYMKNAIDVDWRKIFYLKPDLIETKLKDKELGLPQKINNKTNKNIKSSSSGGSSKTSLKPVMTMAINNGYQISLKNCSEYFFILEEDYNNYLRFKNKTEFIKGLES